MIVGLVRGGRLQSTLWCNLEFWRWKGVKVASGYHCGGALAVWVVALLGMSLVAYDD